MDVYTIAGQDQWESIRDHYRGLGYRWGSGESLATTSLPRFRRIVEEGCDFYILLRSELKTLGFSVKGEWRDKSLGRWIVPKKGNPFAAAPLTEGNYAISITSYDQLEPVLEHIASKHPGIHQGIYKVGVKEALKKVDLVSILVVVTENRISWNRGTQFPIDDEYGSPRPWGEKVETCPTVQITDPSEMASFLLAPGTTLDLTP